MSGRFEGFGEYAVDFYDGLVADNSKSYWTEHRHVYQSDVREPMEALLAELSAEFGTGFGRATVFRPHRDVRFAKDKRPYKDHCGGVIEPGRGAGAYYVDLSPAGILTGGGCFHLHPDQLARYRAAVAEDLHGTELAGILAALERGGWTIKGDRLRTRPRGVAADHPRLDLLRYRSIYAVRSWPPDDVLHERRLLDRVRRSWRSLRAFNEWARDHVGISERTGR